MKHFLLFACMLSTLSVFAQTPTSWGAKIGMNLSQHYGTKDSDQTFKVNTGLRSGCIGGATLEFEVSKNLSLAFEALYSMKGSNETIKVVRLEEDTDGDGIIESIVLDRPAVMDVKYYMDYLEMPVLIKLKVLDKRKWSMDLVTGTAMSIRLRAKHELDGMVYFPDGSGGFSEIPIRDSSRFSELNMLDFSFLYRQAFNTNTKIPTNF